jgi:nicotinamidase-related amidase
LYLNGKEYLIKKGQNPLKEEFSAFANPDLNNFLKSNEITNTFISGLAYDFCVGWTALDSAKNGYNTYVIKDASRAISEETTQEIEKYFQIYDVKIINSADLKQIIF